MKLFSALLLVICSFSCATKAVISQTSESDIKEASEHNVAFFIRQQIPYCGGAAPTDEMLNRSAPYNEELVLINLSDNSKMTINGENGVYYLQLAIGKYALKEKYKDVPYHDFLTSTYNSSNNYTVTGEDQCYKEWWQSNLIEFEVIDPTKTENYHLTVPNRCYTGINPCDYYNGPLPP